MPERVSSTGARDADLLVVTIAEAELLLSASDGDLRTFFAVLEGSARSRPDPSRAGFLLVLTYGGDPAAASAALRQRLAR